MPIGILQVTSVGSLSGQQMLNRWHFYNEDDTAPVAGTLTAFIESVLTPYAGGMSNQLSFTELLYRVITDPLSTQNSQFILPALVGAETTDPAVSFTTATVRWQIGVTAILTAEDPQRRIHRGSKHLGGLIDGYLINNSLSAGCITAAGAVASGYLGLAEDGWLPCVAGFEKIPVPRPKPLPAHYTVPNKYAPILAFTVNAMAGSQVSRKVGHGA